MFIEIKQVSKHFYQEGQRFTALDNVNLSIEKGEFICLLGPSGCGKSTLMNAIAGFEPVEEGSITIDGQKVERPSTSYVTIFQNYGLLPWRNVQKNVELGLEPGRLSRQERREKAEHYIDLVGLSAFSKRYPRQLSGGMQQRVAIARALAVDPEIIFMDEPFGALDAITRMKLQDEVRSLAKRENKTILFVTHDMEEAAYLADRIVIMTPNPGKVKAVLNVELPDSRDRTSDEFVALRSRIFEVFGMKVDRTLEYYI